MWHACTHIYIHEGHSINEVNFAQIVGNRKHFTVAPFQGNQLQWVLSSSRKLSVWPSLLTAAAGIFSLTKSLGVFLP